MNIVNRTRIMSFLLVGGFAAYLLSAALSAIFIVSLPMAPGWCVDWQEFSTGPDSSRTECVLFSDKFEEMKYYHNTEMVSRNKKLMGFEFVFWAVIAGLLFHWIPKWRSSQLAAPAETDAEKFFGIVAIAFAVSIVAPIALGAILPAPVDWFPQVFRDMNDAQVESTLQRLTRAASL